jgi:hypothetical protein
MVILEINSKSEVEKMFNVSEGTYAKNFKEILEWNVVDCMDYGGNIVVYMDENEKINTTVITDNTTEIDINNIIYITKYIEAFIGEVTEEILFSTFSKVEKEIKENISKIETAI